jgi:hypothetical protein
VHDALPPVGGGPLYSPDETPDLTGTHRARANRTEHAQLRRRAGLFCSHAPHGPHRAGGQCPSADTSHEHPRNLHAASSARHHNARHLQGKRPEVVALYHRFIELAQACGPFTYAVSKSAITLKGTRRGFAGATQGERAPRGTGASQAPPGVH